MSKTRKIMVSGRCPLYQFDTVTIDPCRTAPMRNTVEAAFASERVVRVTMEFVNGDVYNFAVKEEPVDVAVTCTFVVSGVDLTGADDDEREVRIAEAAKQYVADNKHALDEPTMTEILS